MLKGDNGESLGGMVGIAINGNIGASTGQFHDKEVFKSLMDNLKYFSASEGQISVAKGIVDTKTCVQEPRGNLVYTRYYSAAKNSTMLVAYGDGHVYVHMYKGT